MKHFLQALVRKENLTEEQSYEALHFVATGQASESEIAAFLMGIQTKGITSAELIGFRKAMLEQALKVDLNGFSAMDLCGTGGDGKDTFNISTTASFIVAGAGQKVAKHGNHGLSSSVGSSTVLEYLGVKFTNDSAFLKNKLEEAGICYMHAPLFHPSMKYVVPVRKALGIKTFFNILGPLLNPSDVKIQFTGVADMPTFSLFVDFFKASDTKFGVVHSTDIYDEISLTSPFHFDNGKCRTYHPEDLTFTTISSAELYGGDSLQESGKILVEVLQNKGTYAQTSAALANAAFALVVARSIDFAEALEQAKESLLSGKAFQSLQKLIQS